MLGRILKAALNLPLSSWLHLRNDLGQGGVKPSFKESLGKRTLPRPTLHPECGSLLGAWGQSTHGPLLKCKYSLCKRFRSLIAVN